MNENIAGIYVHEKTGAHYLELKNNSTYVLVEGTARITGTYRVRGAEITMVGGDSSSSATIQNGVITDSEGDRWIQTEAGVPPWLQPIVRKNLPWELYEAIAWFVILIAVYLGSH